MFLFSCQICMYMYVCMYVCMRSCTKSFLKTTTNFLCVFAHLANKADSDKQTYSLQWIRIFQCYIWGTEQFEQTNSLQWVKLSKYVALESLTHCSELVYSNVLSLMFSNGNVFCSESVHWNSPLLYIALTNTFLVSVNVNVHSLCYLDSLMYKLFLIVV